jgi:hypothetical protein
VGDAISPLEPYYGCRCFRNYIGHVEALSIFVQVEAGAYGIRKTYNNYSGPELFAVCREFIGTGLYPYSKIPGNSVTDNGKNRRIAGPYVSYGLS